jgi:hypothetical protein
MGGKGEKGRRALGTIFMIQGIFEFLSVTEIVQQF